MRVLHFGATGNLGAPTLVRLREAGHDVTAFVRSERRLTTAANRVIVGDATDSAAVKAAIESDDFDVVVSTAGCVDNEARTAQDAAASPFCRIFSNVCDGLSTSRRPPPSRAIFVAGLTLLSLPGAPDVSLQSVVARRAPQYAAHQLNYERLRQTADLDWTLVCPGNLVDAPPSEPGSPLRLSADCLPAWKHDRFRPWMARRPLALPFVLVPFLRKQGVLTVAYADVARVIAEQVGTPPGGEFSGRRLGIANPTGRRLKKSKAARAEERQRRAARDAEPL